MLPARALFLPQQTGEMKTDLTTFEVVSSTNCYSIGGGLRPALNTHSGASSTKWSDRSHSLPRRNRGYGDDS